MAIFLNFLATVMFLAIPGASMKNYDGYSLFQVYPDTQSKVDYLNALDEIPGDLEIQIWTPGTTDSSFDILVSPESKSTFTKNLDKSKIRYEVKIENLQESIEEEKKPVSILKSKRVFSGLPNAEKFAKYLSLEEISSFIQSLASTYPNIVKIQQLGLSYENRSISVVKVGLDTGKKKPSIWIDGGIHSREWIAVSTVTYMLNKLVTGYSNDTQIKSYLDKADWYFVPVLNVDGYKYTHTDNRMWRKNRRPAPSTCREINNKIKCCDGVDLNRNFNHSFGGAATSLNTCNDTYLGTGPFSEPETQAVRDFVLRNAKDMKAFITIHAHAQMWFYPYGNKKESYPDDVQELVALSEKAVNAIREPYGTKMIVGSPAEKLYPASGSSFDWVKSVAKVKYCFAIELRPSRDHGNGFVLPPSNIVPAGEETWAGISVVADEVIKNFAS